jgi:hypothetical protein
VSEYKLKIIFTEPMLASSPANPEVYKEFIASRKQDELPKDEMETLPADKQELAGWSVFHRDDNGLFVFDYHVRGFLKEAAISMVGKDKDKGVPAVRSKIDRWLFVFPRRIYLHGTNGHAITKPDDVLERPIRAMTMQGPRTSLKRSDVVSEGSWLEATIKVLPLGERELNSKLIVSCLDYGEFCGLGEWRTGSYGRFKYEFTASNGSVLLSNGSA